MKKVKAIALTLCVAASMMLTSCAKNQDLIIGKWKCLSAEGVTNGMTEDVGSVYEFKANGKVAIVMAGQNVEFKYSISESTLTIGEGKEASKSDIDILTEKALKISRTGKNKASVVDYERI